MCRFTEGKMDSVMRRVGTPVADLGGMLCYLGQAEDKKDRLVGCLFYLEV